MQCLVLSLHNHREVPLEHRLRALRQARAPQRVLHETDYSCVSVGEEAEYQRHALVRKATRTWDTLGLLFSLLTNLVILKYLISDRGAEPGSTYRTVVLSLLQALQFVAAVWHTAWYQRVRLPIHSMQRLLRLAITLAVHLQGPYSPTQCTRYSTIKSVTDTHLASAARALAAILLVEPLLGVCHALYHHLPWSHHLVYVTARVPLDALFVVPTLGLLVNSRADMRGLADRVCPYVCQVLTSGALGTSSLVADVCVDGSSGYFLAGAAMLVLGNLLPLLVIYWFELKTKLQYLRVRFPGQAQAVPGGSNLGALLLVQLQLGLLLCFCGAQLLAGMHAQRGA